MKIPVQVKSWIAYCAILAAVLVAHACAVEFDAQAAADTSARHT